MRKKALALLAIFGTGFVFSCGQVTTQRTYEGATVGALGGAVAGALIDKNNRWRGAVIGGVLGAIIGGTITEIAS
ncbi:MAG: glycine zipper 2TM domain-containing protein, partial [Aquificaceae bacterium]